ncbi:zinc-dependent metalloprotease [Chitinophaga nivalis]|uniref:Zinc-dependent metalloprotease n=1 Tax=Chitinophaga nivalis TaxID=2991709 RepID=A0ABT3IQ04_9BACT|nr:zinc-dependent metalloprotease [Chitinophaga nivalis]MCW3464281.1 zinc-dependent metalloprotease [Chitinophaga nivalis]MCW3486028.1 zinc-dependent metalloprotease [Chitinophaga nivalis]
MNKQTLSVCGCLLAAFMITSCQKNDKQQENKPDPVSAEVLAQIKANGFSTDNVRKTDDGYLVENDILLTAAQLNEKPTSPVLRIAEVEQYRTNNLVSALPRVIKVKVSGLGAAFVAGADTAIARYNRLGLRITFSRITSGTANITIQGFNEGPSGGYITLGSAGFPSGGNPFTTIKMNTNAAAYGSNPNVLYVGSVIQHEIGHCIGMRHTDYMNRAYSCGGSAVNEGDGGVGAVPIPGTPTQADPNSWMLACSNGGNRTFNANDIIALKYLYQ